MKDTTTGVTGSRSTSESGGLGLGICTSSVNYKVFDQAKNNTVRKSGQGAASNMLAN